MKKSIKIDFATNTIITTKEFYNKACEYGTPENEFLDEILTKYPRMTVRTRSVAKRRKTVSQTKGLTYEYMTAFITTLDKENLISFEETKQYYKKLGYSSTGIYRCVADWFLNTYPNHKDMVIEAEPQPITKAVQLTIAEAV